jgi:hypothetical protein
VKPPDGNIFIYCDDPAHARRIAVRNFYPVARGWNEWFASPAQRARQSGRTLVDDEPPPPGVDDYEGREVRSRYRLECRKCRDRGVVEVRQNKLFAVLNILADRGESSVSLPGVAAMLARIST